MNEVKSFYYWCITKYEDKDNMAGDLARDMKGDAQFPRTVTDKSIILYYLRHRRACKEALEALNYLWKRYEIAVLKDRNKSCDESEVNNPRSI